MLPDSNASTSVAKTGEVKTGELAATGVPRRGEEVMTGDMTADDEATGVAVAVALDGQDVVL